MSSKCKESEIVPMTTCKCIHGPRLVMTRAFLGDLLRFKADSEREKTIEKIVQHLQTKSDVYFGQSLIGGATYFAHKVRTIEELIKEIKEIK